MPYRNQYNLNVANRVRAYSQKHINRENAINDFSTSYEIPSLLEASVLKEPEVHGGSGFAAATVQDLGFEPTLGATSGEGKAKRVRKKVIEVGEGLSAAGVSAAGKSAAGTSATGVSGGEQTRWCLTEFEGHGCHARATRANRPSKGDSQSGGDG